MLDLAKSPRIIPILELETPIIQSDSELYTEIDEQGAADYERTFHPPIREDIYLLAEEIHVLQENPVEPTIDQATGNLKPRRHIDVSTGPNIYPLIASLPFMDEIFAVEYSPANIRHLCKLIGKDYTHITHRAIRQGKPQENPEPLPDYWQDWKYVAALLYNKGGAQGLDNMEAGARDALFEKIDAYCRTMTPDEKAAALRNLHENEPNNPYLQINDLQQALREKVSILRGDIINDTKGWKSSSIGPNSTTVIGGPLWRKFLAKIEMDELKPYIEMYKEEDPLKYAEIVHAFSNWEEEIGRDKDEQRRIDVYKKFFPTRVSRDTLEEGKEKSRPERRGLQGILQSLYTLL